MVFGNTKRIVVIKDIPSNIIEEAIFILKSDPVKKNDDKKNKGKAAVYDKSGKDYLLKEAESVINTYIAENRASDTFYKGVHLTLSSSKKKLATNITINMALFGSIALLIFVISRFF